MIDNNASVSTQLADTEKQEEAKRTYVSDDLKIVMQDLYNQGSHEVREVDIVKAYCKFLKEREKIDYEYNEKQPTVHKALLKLTKFGAVKKIGKKYYLVNPDNTRNLARKAIVSTIRFDKKSVFRVSSTTLVVAPTSDTIHNAKKEFRNYIGDKHCYGIAEIDGYLMIMLTGTKEELSELRKDISSLVKESFTTKKK